MENKENPLEIQILADAVSKGSGSEVENLPSKIDRYSIARHRAVSMIHHVDLEFQSTGSPYFEKVRDGLIMCGNYLHFRHFYTVDKVRLHKANFCKQHLFCPLCAVRRASKQLNAYLKRYQAIVEATPTLTPYLVTLTVKNGLDLLERYNHLVKSVRVLTRNRVRALSSVNSRHRTEFAKIAAAVGSYEFTNRGNGWHPHVHILALCSSEIDQLRLSDEWRKATADSFIVDVTRITSSSETDTVSGFLEVFKYALKFSDLTPEQTIHAATALKGRRLLFSFGLFRGVHVPESLLDEPLDSLPYVDLIYRYLGSAGYSLRY